MMQHIIFHLCLYVLITVNCDGERVVNTNSGPVRGQLLKTIWYNKPYYSFKGVPYAKPPVGELRFKAPEPVDPWTEPRNAFKYAPWCAQRSKRPSSEDCLYLNVFVPVLNDGSSCLTCVNNITKKKKLPVMLYIHGGWYSIGSADDSFQGPDFMLERKVIVVTGNHRLGIFGFMSLGLPQYSGNMGLKDQQLYMKWVYENIEAFGGDKNKITLVGLSAGGSAAGFHLVNEESSKYFNQLIALGGTPNRFHTYQTGDHRCLMEHFYRKYNPKRPGKPAKPSHRELIKFLQEDDGTRIRDFLHDTFSKKYSPWNPVIEKFDAIRPIVTEDPITAISKMKNINKTTYYTIAQYEYLSWFIIGKTNYAEPKVVRDFVDTFNIDLPIFGFKSILDKKPSYLQDVIDRVKQFYFNGSTTDQDLLRQRLILDSDIFFVYDNDKWIEKHAAVSKKDIFYHQFSVQSVINPHPEYPGAGHADEVPFFFRSQELNDGPTKLKDKNDAESQLGFKQMNVMQTLFSNFIKYGKPVRNKDVMKKTFQPIKRSSKASEFNFVDVTNNGLIPSKGPHGNRIEFLDRVIDEVKRLVQQHGDVPPKTPIQQRCEAMEHGIKLFSANTVVFGG